MVNKIEWNKVIGCLSVAVVLVVGAFYAGFRMGKRECAADNIDIVFAAINIFAIILSPIIAVWLSEIYLKRKVFEKEKRFEVLVDLVSYRYTSKAEEKQRQRLLNSLTLLYHDDKELKTKFNTWWGGRKEITRSAKRHTSAYCP